MCLCVCGWSFTQSSVKKPCDLISPPCQPPTPPPSSPSPTAWSHLHLKLTSIMSVHPLTSPVPKVTPRRPSPPLYSELRKPFNGESHLVCLSFCTFCLLWNCIILSSIIIHDTFVFFLAQFYDVLFCFIHMHDSFWQR